MEEDNKFTNDKHHSEEDDNMNANTAIKVDNKFFNEFLRLNKTKINAITPKNPTISKDDEWAKETCWDNDYKELNNK